MAGDVVAAVAQANLPTVSGNVDITTTNFGGGTPAAAIFIVTRDTDSSNTTAADQAGFSIGFTDGTTSYVAAISAQHNVGTTNNNRTAETGFVISMLDPTGDRVIDGQATFVSFITNGVRINFGVGNTLAGAYECEVTLFGGADLQATVGTSTLGNVGTTTAVTSLSYEPDLVFCATHGATISTPENIHSIFSFGAAHNGASISQGAVLHSGEDAAATSNLTARIIADGAVGQAFNGAYNWSAALEAFDANGWDFRVNDGNSGDVVGWLALDLDNRNAYVAVIDSPTNAAADWTVTGVGFTPQLGFLGLTAIQTLDSTITNGDAGALGISVFDGTDAFSAAMSDEDAQATTDTESLAYNNMILFHDDAGATLHQVDNPSFNSDGWTVTAADITTANGTARKWLAVAIEEAAAVGVVARAPQLALMGVGSA